MDQLKFDNAANGMEGAWENLATLQRETMAGFEALAKSLLTDTYDPTNIYILTGCVITDDGQDFTITEGFVFHQNEIFKVEANSFTAPGGQIGIFNLDITPIQTTFRNGQDYDVEETRKIAFQPGASGSGIGDHDEAIEAIDVLTNKVNSKLIDSAPGTLDTLNELAAALGDDPNFATTVLNSIDAIKGTPPAALDTLQKLASAIGNDANFATTINNAIDGKISKANWTTGSWSLADFSFGVTSVNYAEYEYKILDGILFLSAIISFSTNNQLVTVKLPDSLTHNFYPTGSDESIWGKNWRVDCSGNFSDDPVHKVEFDGSINKDRIRIERRDSGGFVAPIISITIIGRVD